MNDTTYIIWPLFNFKMLTLRYVIKNKEDTQKRTRTFKDVGTWAVILFLGSFINLMQNKVSAVSWFTAEPFQRLVCLWAAAKSCGSTCRSQPHRFRLQLISSVQDSQAGVKDIFGFIFVPCEEMENCCLSLYYTQFSINIARVYTVDLPERVVSCSEWDL